MRINWVHPIIGVLICGSAAALTAIRYFGHPAPENLPLVFLIVVLCVSLRFGVSAGIVGCIVSALIFAVFTYRPIGSLAVSDEGARANLGWMVLAGVALSYLLSPPSGRHTHHRQ
ncbi:MAG TPA: DUF4118 domain-containing protein [Terriglobales bacterium]|nr:DUF4118 domain-containing protein [Terriglobales bacterium]